MPYRARYIAQVNPPCRPTLNRVGSIYQTIARAIHGVNQIQKQNLLNRLQNILLQFDANYVAHLTNQVTFNTWHSNATNSLMGMPFQWHGANGVSYQNLSFGAAQKFINLGLKDWWAVSPNGTGLSSVQAGCLHGVFDNLVYACTSRYVAPLPTLKGPNGTTRSFVYYLNGADYDTYQNHLDAISNRLQVGLGLAAAPKRIEIEQLLWGWI